MPHVAEFYEKQGKLYDLQAELERAWTAYRTAPETFSSFVVRQDSSPAASSERVFYFRTNLTRTVSGNIVQEATLCAAFDRETGINIPLDDLFVCQKEDIGKKLLDLAEKGGTGPADPAVKAEMQAPARMAVEKPAQMAVRAMAITPTAHGASPMQSASRTSIR